MVHLCIGVGTFVSLYSLFQWASSETSFETDVQRGQPLPKGNVAVDMGPGTELHEHLVRNRNPGIKTMPLL